MRTHFWKKISDTKNMFFFLLGCFCRKPSGHADMDSREQQAILLKKFSKYQANIQIAFLLYFPANVLARFCHAVLDFREQHGLPSD